jgi:hypothetical protein
VVNIIIIVTIAIKIKEKDIETINSDITDKKQSSIKIIIAFRQNKQDFKIIYDLCL